MVWITLVSLGLAWNPVAWPWGVRVNSSIRGLGDEGTTEYPDHSEREGTRPGVLGAWGDLGAAPVGAVWTQSVITREKVARDWAWGIGARGIISVQSFEF